jgi:hypothetical protein
MQNKVLKIFELFVKHGSGWCRLGAISHFGSSCAMAYALKAINQKI